MPRAPRQSPLPDFLLSLLSGEWVLVTAAAGGVGIAAVQLAKGKSFMNLKPGRCDSISIFHKHWART